jgi:hypothetical protein
MHNSSSPLSSTHVPAQRLAIVACAVLDDEVNYFAHVLSNLVHLEILPQGLHNDPPLLREKLQDAVTRIEDEHAPDAIALVYGLCSRGTEGVTTRKAKLVIPRAHDCITLLLGSKNRYASYVSQNPGTYWYSPGWNKHHVPPGKQRYDLLRAQYVEKFGEDNADFLMEAEQAWFSEYDRATFVHLGVALRDDDVEYTKQCAQWLGWNYDEQSGDPGLLQSLLGGDWDDERFVVLQPGETIRMTADERVITPCTACTGCDMSTHIPGERKDGIQ